MKHIPESNIVYIIPNRGRYFPEWLIDGAQDCLEDIGRVTGSSEGRMMGQQMKIKDSRVGFG